MPDDGAIEDSFLNNAPASAIQECLDPPPPVLIYRSGSATPNNLTPRATDVTGLSAFKVATGEKQKHQEIDTSKLKLLKAVCDNKDTGHFSIVPCDSAKMAEWIASKGKNEIHPFTQELMDAIIRTVKT